MSEHAPSPAPRGEGTAGKPGESAAATLAALRRRNRRHALFHVVTGALGLGAITALVHRFGAANLLGILRTSARWLPLLLAFEAVRIACETAGTLMVLPAIGSRVPLSSLVRTHMISFAVSNVMPAGRAAAEGAKAALLSRHIGLARAAAVAATNQAMALLAGVVVALVCASAAYASTGASAITLAVAVYGIVAAGGFVCLQLAARRPFVGGFLGRHFVKAKRPAAAFRDALRAIPVVPGTAMAFAVAGRALQGLEIAVLLHATGARGGLPRTLVAQGIYAVGGGAGDLIPGQLGATDGAFALGAGYLGITAAAGVAIAVMLHCVQLCWTAVGMSCPLWWRERARSVRDETLEHGA